MEQELVVEQTRDPVLHRHRRHQIDAEGILVARFTFEDVPDARFRGLVVFLLDLKIRPDARTQQALQGGPGAENHRMALPRANRFDRAIE